MEHEIRVIHEIRDATDTVKTHKLLSIDVTLEIECFERPNRMRTFTAIFAASAQQVIGATFVIGYSTYFFELIGIKDYFSASIGLYIVILLASTSAFPLTEIFGRRFLIVVPKFVLYLMLLNIGIVGCMPDKTRAS